MGSCRDMTNSNDKESANKKLKLNKVQKEILVGILLGDGCLETRNGGRTYRLKIEQSLKHKPYVEHLFKVFNDFVSGNLRERTVISKGCKSQNIRFQTVSSGAFRFFGKQFYRNGQKSVPRLVHRMLTPQGLAYWFMDDGSIKSKESKGIVFNTHGFNEKEVSKLCEVLNTKFGLICKRRHQKDGNQIYVSGKSYERFVRIISEYVHPSMGYKIPSARQT